MRNKIIYDNTSFRNSSKSFLILEQMSIFHFKTWEKLKIKPEGIKDVFIPYPHIVHIEGVFFLIYGISKRSSQGSL